MGGQRSGSGWKWLDGTPSNLSSFFNSIICNLIWINERERMINKKFNSNYKVKKSSIQMPFVLFQH